MRGIAAIVAAACLLSAGCASLPGPGRAGVEARGYLASEEGRRRFPGASAGEPIRVLAGDAEGIHAHVVPFVSGGLVVGYGESFPDREGFVATALDVPRGSLLKATREEVLRWATELTGKRGPFFATVVDGPFLVYRDPRGYSWGVRFARPEGGYVVYKGGTVVLVSKAF